MPEFPDEGGDFIFVHVFLPVVRTQSEHTPAGSRNRVSAKIEGVAMRLVLMGVAAVALAACEPAPPPQPSQAEMVLQQLCAGGDAQACAAILQAEDNAKQRRMTAGMAVVRNMQEQRLQQQSTTTNCNPTLGGGVSCSSF